MTCFTRAMRIITPGFVAFGITSLCCAQTDPLSPYVFSPVTITAGGYVPGLVAHPTEPGLSYVRTDIGGVYRWNSSTSAWTPLLDFNAPANYNLTGPESIALDPANPQMLYIAAGMYTSGPFAFLVSNDQGKTFKVYPETSFTMAANNDGRAAGERLAVNPFRPAELFMGTRSSGLWISADGAQTWTKSPTFPVSSSSDGFGVQFVVFDPNNAGTVYAGAYTTSLVYVSHDDGATWAALPAVNWPFTVPTGTHAPAPERALLNSDGNLYVTMDDSPGPNSTAHGIVEKYNPKTQQWTNITPPPDGIFQTAPAGGFVGLTQDPNRSGVVAVSTLDRWYPVDTVYVTRDGGGSWVDLGSTTSASGVDGPAYGNYYFDSSVYSATPYLTFGNSNYPKAPQPTAKFGWWLSALLIDPTKPDHLLYGTGATIYATNNESAATLGAAPTWYVQASGIEETAVLAMISPTQGAHLISGVGDIGGFRHDDFTVSPVGGMFTNPVATTVGSLDYAGQNPSMIVRAQAPSTASTSPCNYGAYSGDGGTTWAPFPKCATGSNSGNGGSVAVDAGGTMFMWSPATGSSNRPQSSTDGGNTWSATTGLASRVNAYADKVTPKLFYAYVSGSNGGFYSTTTSDGSVFTKVNTTPASFTTGGCYGSGCGVVARNWAKAGDVWLPLGSNGLYHSADGGTNWMKLSVAEADAFAVGAIVPGTAVQSVFLYGVPAAGGFRGIYRSDDLGTTWFQVNDANHQYGGPTLIAADPRVYGRVFLGMNGRGIVHIDSAVVASPTVVLTTTATLSGSASLGYTATVTVTNTGTGPAGDVALTTETLGSAVGSATSQTLGTIAGNGGSATVAVTFLGTAGPDGARTIGKFGGTYVGGTFGGGLRAVLP